MQAKDADNPPFFILGCVRSGTTLLRNMLRKHPRLECPEETHFFRWGDPFGTQRYMHPYTHDKNIQQQQRMDGISEEEFSELLKVSNSRSDIAENYGRLYLEKQGNPNGRWFDKTPQNVYGILLISYMMPEAKFIHIYRNPLNVVASLYAGKVLSIADITAATSYWYESMSIMQEYKKIAADRLLEIPYEQLTDEPQDSLDTILNFLGEEVGLVKLAKNFVHQEKNKYVDMFTESDIQAVKERCSPLLQTYGYD